MYYFHVFILATFRDFKSTNEIQVRTHLISHIHIYNMKRILTSESHNFVFKPGKPEKGVILGRYQLVEYSQINRLLIMDIDNINDIIFQYYDKSKEST